MANKICGCKVDKKEIFIEAIKTNERLIYKVAAIYTNTTEDKYDLVQEIIYQLWKSFDSYNQQALLSTWMYRVAMNVAIYHLSVSKRKISTIPMNAQLADMQEEVSMGMEEKWQILKQHINHLSLLDKGIVMLYMEDKSYEEIAQITGISATNVGTRLFRIKEKLKKQINKQL